MGPKAEIVGRTFRLAIGASSNSATLLKSEVWVPPRCEAQENCIIYIGLRPALPLPPSTKHFTYPTGWNTLMCQSVSHKSAPLVQLIKKTHIISVPCTIIKSPKQWVLIPAGKGDRMLAFTSHRCDSAQTFSIDYVTFLQSSADFMTREDTFCLVCTKSVSTYTLKAPFKIVQSPSKYMAEIPWNLYGHFIAKNRL